MSITYYKILNIKDVDIASQYEFFSGESVSKLNQEMMGLYRKGILKRRTDSSHFMKRRMNDVFIGKGINVRVC